MDSIKIREYLKSITINNDCERPLNAISPIDTTSEDIVITNATNQYKHVASLQLSKQTVLLSSPYLQSHTLHRQHSTPKPSTPRVNFHSISDLAQSSCSTPNSSSSHLNESVSLSTSGYQTALSDKWSQISTSLFDNKENSNSIGQFVDLKSDTSARRKPRTQISREHREVLEQVYAVNKYPDANEVENLCKLLGFEENVIRVSFP